MSAWEYKVVPAPTKGLKGRGVKGPEGRFANALEGLMNEMGASGWEYQRAETLPSVERSGLTGSTTEWRNVLVFRRTVVQPMDDFEPELLPPPAADAPVIQKAAEPDPVKTEPAIAKSAQRAPVTRGDAPAESKTSDASDGPKGMMNVTASIKGSSGTNSEPKSNA